MTEYIYSPGHCLVRTYYNGDDNDAPFATCADWGELVGEKITLVKVREHSHGEYYHQDLVFHTENDIPMSPSLLAAYPNTKNSLVVPEV